MGQAKQRGTREQRVALAVERQREQLEQWKQQWEKAERRRRAGGGADALNARAILAAVLRSGRVWQ